MKRFLRDNGLSVAFGLAFLVVLLGQAFAGQADYNNRQIAEGGPLVSFGQYRASSDFAVNWQSEYLQFFLYVFAIVWLVQRGSPESKPADKIGPETDEEQKPGMHSPNNHRNGPAPAAGAPRSSPAPSGSPWPPCSCCPGSPNRSPD